MRTSRRSSRRSTRSGRSPARATSTSSVPAPAASRCRRCSATSPPRRERKVHSATLAVCVLDMSAVRGTTAGLFVTPATIAAAKAASRKRGVVWARTSRGCSRGCGPTTSSGTTSSTTICWATSRPRTRSCSGTTTRRGCRRGCTPISSICSKRIRFRVPESCACAAGRSTSAKVGIDTYVVGGLTDHITPWQGVYRHGTALRQRAQHVRSRQRRPHPEPRQSAGEQAVVVRRGSGASGNARSMARAAREDGRLLVAALARVDPRALRPGRSRHPRGLAASGISALAAAPGTYVLER